MALAVNQTGGNATTVGSGGPISFTFGSDTVSGSLIVAPVVVFNPANPWAASAWTDSKSNSYTLLDNDGVGTAEHTGVAYNNAGTRGASHQLTHDPAGTGQSTDFGAIEFTGHDSSTPFETAVTGKANDTASPFDVTASAAFPSGAAGVYFASIGGSSGNVAIGNPTGYTAVMSQGDADTSLVGYIGYKLSESGTPTVGCTWTGTVGAESPREMLIAVRAATGAAAPTDSPYPTEPLVDPQGWMFSYRSENVPFFPDLTPYSADTPTATGDVSLVGYLPVGVHPYATVTADRNLAGVAYVGIHPLSTISHDASMAGIIHAGAPQLSTSSHDVTLAGILYSGPFALTSGGFDYITTGVLYATAVPMGIVSHTTSVAGILEAGVTPYSTVSHAANVTGLVPAGVTPYSTVTHDTSIAGILYTAAFALNGPSFDYNVAGILYIGAAQRTTATADRTVAGIVHVGPLQVSTVTATRSVAGWLPVAPGHVAVVTRSTSTLGLVVVGVAPYATFGPVAPLSPVTDTLYLTKPWEAVELERTGTLWLRSSSTVDTGKATDTPWRRTHQGQVIE